MKGVVISNCGTLGIDWDRLSLSGYLEAMAAYSGMGEPGKPDVTVTPALRRFAEHHRATGNA